MGAKKISLFLIAGALVLFVLLFNAPKSASAEAAPPPVAGKEVVAENATLDVFLKMALKSIEPSQKLKFDKLLDSNSFDSLSVFWTRVRRPDLASYFAEEKARQSQKAEDWFTAGNRFYYSVQFTQDKSEVPVLYQSAIRCFKSGLRKDPKNVDAGIMLASCYVDGSADPMQGISRLREIEKTDSNNVKLQITFASFSVKSGQYEKAIRRFKKVLDIDSTYIEAYLHLADAYEQTGNKAETIHMLEKYAARTPDITSKLEVNNYIKQLKEIK
ncbi:MAG: tetratricopeptide repeat protein [bacterium]|nr:tetratricopeptide repeat protein [bacterium]